MNKSTSVLPYALITFAIGIGSLILLRKLDWENSDILVTLLFPLFYVSLAAVLSLHRVLRPRIYIFCLCLATYLSYFAFDSQFGLFSLQDGHYYRVVPATRETEYLVLGTFPVLPLLVYSLWTLLATYLIFRFFPKKPR